MDRVWVILGSSPGEERPLADTAPSKPLPVPGWQVVLQRGPDGRMRWVRAHMLAGAPGAARASGSERAALHRIRVEVAGETLGSVWALRSRDLREPDRAETRILAAAADQLGPGHRPRSAGPGGDERGDRPPERGSEDGPARLRFARPSHSAGHDPSGGGQHARRVGGLDGCRPARGLPGDRQRSRTNGPARSQPARPQPYRRRSPQAGARAVRSRRSGDPGGQARRRRPRRSTSASSWQNSCLRSWPTSCT